MDVEVYRCAGDRTGTPITTPLLSDDMLIVRGIDAVSTVRLSVGDKVRVINGVATLTPVASVVETV